MIPLGATMIKTEEELKEDWQCEAKNTERARKDYYNKIVDGFCHCPEPEPTDFITVNALMLPVVKDNFKCKLCNGIIPSHKLLANDKKQKVKGGKRIKKL